MNTMKDLILIGGGGHCKAVIDVAECAGYNILGILERPEFAGDDVLGYKIIGDDSDIRRYADKALFVVTVGQIKSPATRIRLHEELARCGGRLATIISPYARVSRHASIGEGTVVMHNALVNAGAAIGKGCIINSFACIEHEVKVGDYCHISTGAIVNGCASIGNGCFIGSQSVVNNGILIGDDVTVASFSLVNKNITYYGLYAGVPAEPLKTDR